MLCTPKLSQQVFEYRVNNNKIINKVILKSKLKYNFGEIIYQEIIAISIYALNKKGKKKLICAFGYEYLKQMLFLDNEEAVICLGKNLKIPLIEIFENCAFKTTLLRKIKIE